MITYDEDFEFELARWRGLFAERGSNQSSILNTVYDFVGLVFVRVQAKAAS
jgi:hypothetical protein